MGVFDNDYVKKLKYEFEQLAFLSADDAKILFKSYKKANMDEYVRLACIAKVFGYNRVLIKICATVERDMDKFIEGLNNLKGNFALLDCWINNFISAIKKEEVRDLAAEYWEQFKQQIDKENFSVAQI